MDQKDYEDGDIVWVKLGNCWWPGEVCEQTRMPAGILKSVKKPPLYVVQFFDEGKYEYVKNKKNICKYSDNRKNEFIRKGLDLFRSNKKYMEKFPGDVSKAERLTDGDPDIVSSTEFSPVKKPSYSNIFGGVNMSDSSAAKKKSGRKVKETRTIAKKISPAASIRSNISVMSTPIIPRTNNVDPYNCKLCSFTTNRCNIMIIHMKTHSRTSTTPKGNDSNSSLSSIGKPNVDDRSEIENALRRKLQMQLARESHDSSGEDDEPVPIIKLPPKARKTPKKPGLKHLILADWSEDEDDNESQSQMDTRQLSNKTANISLHASSEPTKALTPPPAAPKIRNIPKKDRRDIVLNEFNNILTPPNDVVVEQPQSEIIEKSPPTEEIRNEQIMLPIGGTNENTEENPPLLSPSAELPIETKVLADPDEGIKQTTKEPTANASCFDFKEDEDENDDFLSSLSKLKEKYLSPEKSQSIDEPMEDRTVASVDQKETEKRDEQLAVDIENLLNDTRTPLGLKAESEIPQDVRALPPKERGKRIFKSRNRSQLEKLTETKPMETAAPSDLSPPKHQEIELLNSNNENQELSETVRAETPPEPVTVGAETPFEPVTVRAETPLEPVTVRAETPLEPVTVRAGTPLEPVTIRAETQLEPVTIRAETPLEPVTVRAETPFEPVTVRAETPLEPVTVRAETPLESATVRAETPLEPVTVRAETPLESVTVRAETPLEPVTVRAETPLEPVIVRAETPLEPVIVRAETLLEPVTVRAETPLEPVTVRADTPLEPVTVRAETLLEPVTVRAETPLEPVTVPEPDATAEEVCIDDSVGQEWQKEDVVFDESSRIEETAASDDNETIDSTIVEFSESNSNPTLADSELDLSVLAAAATLISMPSTLYGDNRIEPVAFAGLIEAAKSEAANTEAAKIENFDNTHTENGDEIRPESIVEAEKEEHVPPVERFDSLQSENDEVIIETKTVAAKSSRRSSRKKRQPRKAKKAVIEDDFNAEEPQVKTPQISEEIVEEVMPLREQRNLRQSKRQKAREAIRASPELRAYRRTTRNQSKLAEIQKNYETNVEEMVNETEAGEPMVSNVEEMTGTVEKLAGTVEKLAGTVEELAGTTEEAADTVEDVTETVEEVAETAGEVAETVGEVTETVEEVAETVEEVAETVEEVAETVEEVAETVEEVTETVEEVAEIPGEMAETVEEVAETVGEVAKTIEDVAETVEEVEQTVEEVEEAVEEVEESIEEVEETVEEVSETVEEVTEAVEEATEIVEELAVASEEVLQPIYDYESHTTLENVVPRVESNEDSVLENVGRRKMRKRKSKNIVDVISEDETKSLSPRPSRRHRGGTEMYAVLDSPIETQIPLSTNDHSLIEINDYKDIPVPVVTSEIEVNEVAKTSEFDGIEIEKIVANIESVQEAPAIEVTDELEAPAIDGKDEIKVAAIEATDEIEATGKLEAPITETIDEFEAERFESPADPNRIAEATAEEIQFPEPATVSNVEEESIQPVDDSIDMFAENSQEKEEEFATSNTEEIVPFEENVQIKESDEYAVQLAGDIANMQSPAMADQPVEIQEVANEEFCILGDSEMEIVEEIVAIVSSHVDEEEKNENFVARHAAAEVAASIEIDPTNGETVEDTVTMPTGGHYESFDDKVDVIETSVPISVAANTRTRRSHLKYTPVKSNLVGQQAVSLKIENQNTEIYMPVSIGQTETEFKESEPEVEPVISAKEISSDLEMNQNVIEANLSATEFETLTPIQLSAAFEKPQITKPSSEPVQAEQITIFPNTKPSATFEWANRSPVFTSIETSPKQTQISPKAASPEKKVANKRRLSRLKAPSPKPAVIMSEDIQERIKVYSFDDEQTDAVDTTRKTKKTTKSTTTKKMRFFQSKENKIEHRTKGESKIGAGWEHGKHGSEKSTERPKHSRTKQVKLKNISDVCIPKYPKIDRKKRLMQHVDTSEHSNFDATPPPIYQMKQRSSADSWPIATGLTPVLNKRIPSEPTAWNCGQNIVAQPSSLPVHVDTPPSSLKMKISMSSSKQRRSSKQQQHFMEANPFQPFELKNPQHRVDIVKKGSSRSKTSRKSSADGPFGIISSPRDRKPHVISSQTIMMTAPTFTASRSKDIIKTCAGDPLFITSKGNLIPTNSTTYTSGCYEAMHHPSTASSQFSVSNPTYTTFSPITTQIANPSHMLQKMTSSTAAVAATSEGPLHVKNSSVRGGDTMKCFAVADSGGGGPSDIPSLVPIGSGDNSAIQHSKNVFGIVRNSSAVPGGKEAMTTTSPMKESRMAKAPDPTGLSQSAQILDNLLAANNGHLVREQQIVIRPEVIESMLGQPGEMSMQQQPVQRMQQAQMGQLIVQQPKLPDPSRHQMHEATPMNMYQTQQQCNQQIRSAGSAKRKKPEPDQLTIQHRRISGNLDQTPNKQMKLLHQSQQQFKLHPEEQLKLEQQLLQQQQERLHRQQQEQERLRQQQEEQERLQRQQEEQEHLRRQQEEQERLQQQEQERIQQQQEQERLQQQQEQEHLQQLQHEEHLRQEQQMQLQLEQELQLQQEQELQMQQEQELQMQQEQELQIQQEQELQMQQEQELQMQQEQDLQMQQEQDLQIQQEQQLQLEQLQQEVDLQPGQHQILIHQTEDSEGVVSDQLLVQEGGNTFYVDLKNIVTVIGNTEGEIAAVQLASGETLLVAQTIDGDANRVIQDQIHIDGQLLLTTDAIEEVGNQDILVGEFDPDAYQEGQLIGNVLQIETSEGIKFIQQPIEYQLITNTKAAATNETNAIMPPIMSTLEIPSSKSELVINSSNGGGSKTSETGLIGQNLNDSLTVIGVTTQSTAVPSSLELPITITNPAIASKTSNSIGMANIYGQQSQISPTLSSQDASQLGYELFTSSNVVVSHNQHVNIFSDGSSFKTNDDSSVLENNCLNEIILQSGSSRSGGVLLHQSNDDYILTNQFSIVDSQSANDSNAGFSNSSR